MTTEAFPEMSDQLQQGDGALIAEAARRTRRQQGGRRGTGGAGLNRTSLYTEAVEEAVAFMGEMKPQFSVVAGFMKKRLDRRQIRNKLEHMTPEERMAMTNLKGRPFLEAAARIMGE